MISLDEGIVPVRLSGWLDWVTVVRLLLILVAFLLGFSRELFSTISFFSS